MCLTTWVAHWVDYFAMVLWSSLLHQEHFVVVAADIHWVVIIRRGWGEREREKWGVVRLCAHVHVYVDMCVHV